MSALRLRTVSALALAATLSGCALFASIFNPEDQAQAQQQREAEQAAAEQARVDELRTQLDATQIRASATGATSADVLAYAEAANAALQGGLAAELTPDEQTALEAMLREHIAATNGELQRDLLLAEGTLLVLSGRPDESATHYLAGMRDAPSPELFDALAALPSSPTADAAVLESCPLVRPLLDGEAVFVLVDVCLARGGGHVSQLTWPEAREDLLAYQAELDRSEAAQREAEAEAARREAEAREAEARLAGTREKVLAATYAAGRCRFSNCPTDGWDIGTNAGTLESRCRFSNCLEDGWDTRLPSGGTAETRCRFSKCATDGWDTRFPDGSTLEVRCRFGKCFEDGWDLQLRGGDEDDRGQSRCRFGKCFEDGWDTDMSSGVDLDCRCRFSKCLEDGTECG